MPKIKNLQRDKNITIWVDRKYHKKLKMISWKKGVSITYIINSILKGYFEKGNK